MITRLYRHSLALLNDLYQLTMAYGYWKLGIAGKRASFYLSFRNNPFGGGFTLAAGLEQVIEFVEHARFTEEDVAYLGTLRGNDGRPLFQAEFFEFLRGAEPSCDIDAVPEGTAVFPHEPLIRVTGPLWQAQILETPLLNLINFQSLIATKAARVCLAAQGQPVLEFGLRRAQGIDGGISASRAAYIGGCAGTSNILAGQMLGIPIGGTHAHSWVMVFADELESFLAYAEALPNNCVFLVDTYNTIEGVRHAIEAGKWLRQHGHELVGIRLDSGDLAYLSIEARKMFDETGFPNARIYASNDLDEHIITSLKDQGARIDVWGVGTRLVTSFDQPALGGVYKLGAIRDDGGPWRFKLKLSEQVAKMSTPGILQVRRFRTQHEFIGDAIYSEHIGIEAGCTIIDPLDITRRKHFGPATLHEDLLAPVFRGGKLVYQRPSLGEIRQRAAGQLAMFHSGIKRFVNPHSYPVGLERRLHELRTELILKARGGA